MAADATGYVKVYESSDGGTGDPHKTTWQFFVDEQAVSTTNRYLAETVRLAVETSSQVRVTYDPQNGNALFQVRIEFEYACETRRLVPCKSSPPPGNSAKP